MSKKFLLLFLLVVFCLSSGVHAAWYWKNTAGDEQWVNGGNWDAGYPVAPDAATALSWALTTVDQYPPTEVGPGDAALGQLCRIGQNAGTYGHVKISGGSCTVREIRLGDGGPGVIDCNGLGSLTTTTYDIDLGYTATGDGTLNVWDDATVTVQRYMEVGGLGTGTLNISDNAVLTLPVQYLTIGASSGAVGTVNLSGNGTINLDDYVHVGRAGTGTLNMTGGTINITNYEVNIADGGGTGTLNLSAGTISTGRNFNVGGANSAGTAVMNMTDGIVNCALKLNIPETAGCQATLNLEGGTFRASTLTMKTGGLLNVAGGTLRLNGDVETAIETNSQIVGYEGYGTVDAVYDGSTYTTVTATGPATPVGLSPTGSDVDPASDLSWVSVAGATTATVYFGESQALVNAGDASVEYTGVTSPFDVVAGDMPFATTYYWRVVEEVGGTPYASPTVSFTSLNIIPEAYDLSPVGLDAPITSDLDWTPGYYATESHVYFGTDEAAVTARSSDPNIYRGNQTPPYDPVAEPNELELYTTYYWVVDTVGDDGEGTTFWPGTVVSFTTERPPIPTTATWDPIDPNNNLEWDALANWSPDRQGAGVTSTIANGDPNGKPAIVTNGYTATEAKYVNIGDSGLTGKVRVEAGSTLETAAAGEIRVGFDADGYLEVDGGTAIGAAWFEVGTNAGAHGTVTITNGGTVSTNQYDYNKYASGGADTIVSSGGTLSPTRDLYIGTPTSIGYPHTLTINDANSLARGNSVFIGYADGTSGSVTVNDGTLRGSNLRVGQLGDGLLTVNGGLVEAASLRIPYVSSTGSGHVQLDGGLITASSFGMYDNGTIDITGGTLKIDGDAVNQVLNTYAGFITAYDGWGTVVADHNDVLDVTTVTAIAPDGSVIEPFESYDDTTELKGTWSETGSTISLETTNVFAGQKAMRLVYSGSSSEASKALSLDISDITTFDAKALTLYFAGTAGNTDLPLSVRLESTGGNASVDYDASTSLDDTDWMEWNINLAGFTGVDLNAVTKIAIIVGDGGASGSGTLYIDQIHLNPARCIPDFATGDTNGDCISDLIDFSVLAQDWLDSGYTVTPSDPGTTGLVLHYTLDDPNVLDETANDYDGVASGTGGGFPATGGFDGGGYLSLEGGNWISVPPASLSTVATTGEVSVSVWIRGDTSEPITSRQMLFNARANISEGHILTANMPLEGEIVFEAGHITPQEPEWQSFYWGWDSTEWEAPTSAYRGTIWNHYVFTKDVAAGEQKIYHNGQLVAITKNATTPIEYVGLFTIGNFYPGGPIEYYGDVDDFKVYDRALTPDEVLYLAGGSSYFQPLISDADFDGSDDIGMDDLAILVSKWIEEQLWPTP